LHAGSGSAFFEVSQASERSIASGVLFLSLVAIAGAAGEPTPPSPGPEQAADAVVAALKASDAEALEVLAAKDDPDPWLVADELIWRGEHDAAEAFARAAPRADVEALVLFGLLEEESCALVVTKEAARIVSLCPTAKIEEAVKGLTLEDAESDASAALAALAALADLVVKPLALSESGTRVLVSPSGALSCVPFAALMPEVTVSCVPSGTAYRLLLEDAGKKGEGVLALGDPDYQTKPDEAAVAVNRGSLGRLVPLPATREEAKAVGTVVLLGAEATESGLRDALAKKPRWRAVHLACHGLVDGERPARSSLALTAGGGEDGFLTCLEVFRLKIPADLVVLSACETAKGKVVKSEGIVGLTRGFMFAGSPRVICSLWKVDDEATRALMEKFYELWNPKDGSAGLPTAEALRQAQTFVRSQEKWKHPLYWAAWQLWGLPE
jgi:CHAT domain-containing protein